jgi:hypothetical protein
MQCVRLRVMASHGVVSTGALTPESFGLTPGDYATFNFHQLRYGTVEFVPATDRYVSQWWSDDTYTWYTTENFRAVLESRFTTVRDYPSEPEPRLMFLCEV